jgi:hypothetical protein
MDNRATNKDEQAFELWYRQFSQGATRQLQDILGHEISKSIIHTAYLAGFNRGFDRGFDRGSDKYA